MLIVRVLVALFLILFLGILMGLNINNRVDINLLPKVSFSQVSVLAVIFVSYIMGLFTLIPILLSSYFGKKKKQKMTEFKAFQKEQTQPSVDDD